MKYDLCCCVVRCCRSWVVFAGFFKLGTCNISSQLFAQTFLHKILLMNYHPTHLCKVLSSVPRIEWDQQYLSASRTSRVSDWPGKPLYRLPPEKGKWGMTSFFLNILISPWKSWDRPHIWQHGGYLVFHCWSQSWRKYLVLLTRCSCAIWIELGKNGKSNMSKSCRPMRCAHWTRSQSRDCSFS